MEAKLIANVDDMTDREIAEETLLHLRTFAAAIETLSQNPMVSAMMPPGMINGNPQ